MGNRAKITMLVAFLAVVLFVSPVILLHPVQAAMSYKQAGLTDQQAALHLLNRFTFGPRPGDVDKLVKMGLENWLDQQFTGDFPEIKLNQKLQDYPVLSMKSQDIVDTYPDSGTILAEAKREGFVPKDGLVDPAELKSKIALFETFKGYRPQQELMNSLYEQKILRALYSEQQLTEVMTDFWFNHFNVSVTQNRAKPYILAYERDAIRPHALGKFLSMLQATAEHPAMLYYLDNAESIAPQNFSPSGTTVARKGGINENYARELMELHTLGVDGGYSQVDVQEAARILTGWTVLPRGNEGAAIIAKMQNGTSQDVMNEDGYWFRQNYHDAGEKNVLGHVFTGNTPQDGKDLLTLLAHHPATAHHIAYQFAQRFDSDNPPPALVERLTKAFMDSGGSTKALVYALTASKEFWAEAKQPTKIKTSLEFVVSAMRSGNAEMTDAKGVLSWINRMGHPLYNSLPPTGYPNQGDFWLNSGTLFTRINYSFALAYGGIHGVQLDPAINSTTIKDTGDDPHYQQGVLWSAPDFQIH